MKRRPYTGHRGLNCHGGLHVSLPFVAYEIRVRMARPITITFIRPIGYEMQRSAFGLCGHRWTHIHGLMVRMARPITITFIRPIGSSRLNSLLPIHGQQLRTSKMTVRSMPSDPSDPSWGFRAGLASRSPPTMAGVLQSSTHGSASSPLSRLTLLRALAFHHLPPLPPPTPAIFGRDECRYSPLRYKAPSQPL
jgi:hypothetical protein